MGRKVLIGPAGSGKTTALATAISRQAEKRGPNSVLATSYTKAAAVEIAGRNLPVNPERVGTLHAIGYRLLGQPPLAESKIAEFREQYKWALGSHHLKRGQNPGKDDLGFVFGSEGDQLDAWNEARGRLREEKARCYPEFIRDWELWKRTEGYVDFTDMVYRPYKEGMPPPEGAEVLFSDEHQDMSPLLNALIEQWGQQLDEYTVCGDPRQVLYSHLGAKPELMLGAAAEEECLPRSYRLPRRVKAYADRVAGRLRANHGRQVFEAREAEGEVRELGYRKRVEAEDIVWDAMSREGTSMILATCSYLLNPVLAVLRREGVPFHNPYRPARGDWNLLRSARAGETSTAERFAAFIADEEDGWTAAQLRTWLPLVKATGVLKRGVATRLKELTEAELVSMPDEDFWTTGEPPAKSGEWLLEHATSTTEHRLGYLTKVVERNGIEGLFAVPKLTIGTFHSVKGGEANNVYLMTDISHSAAKSSDQDALTRVAYVGSTRARESLTIVAPFTKLHLDMPAVVN